MMKKDHEIIKKIKITIHKKLSKQSIKEFLEELNQNTK